MVAIKSRSERCILVGIRHSRESPLDAQESLFELERLAHTAGAVVVAINQQEVKKIDSAFYIGHGKVQELAAEVTQYRAETVVFDEDLTPGQHRNLQEELKCKVVDRTGLILDIFAQHAESKEGKLQVELAQCYYLMPRLVGQWEHFGRLGGGIGTRGPGETQLEVDRRRVREKIGRIRNELGRVQRSRQLHRSKREGVPIPTVAMVGYTNAGKSTLMNALTEADVLVEDKLFATLDPTVRRLRLPSGRQVLLSDTVGFIRKLPHPLVEAFKATFEEVRAADLILHVIDSSHPTSEQQKSVVNEVLGELELNEKPVLEVYNKIDLLGPSAANGHGVRVSARNGIGIESLLRKIEALLHQNYLTCKVRVPYLHSSHLDWLYRVGEVKSRKDLEDGVHMRIALSPQDVSRARRDKTLKVKVL